MKTVKPKVEKPRKPANRRVRLLRSKLEALAAVGIGGEKTNAQDRLDKLLLRYDFKAKDVQLGDMFAGRFCPSPVSRFLATFPRSEQDIAAAAKWAIEHATQLRASFRGDELHVEASSESVRKLTTITTRITEGFRTLWHRFETAPGISPRDRGLFFRGLYDGMMQDARALGEPLPQRHVEPLRGRTKKLAVTTAPGIGIHPYSVALDLGRQLRFETPITEIVTTLEDKIGERKQLT